MSKTTTEQGKGLYQYMETNDLLDYGAVMSEEELHRILEVEYPEQATRQEFATLDFVILGATDYVRNVLLGQGKALESHRGDIKVLLLSENAKYIEKYMRSADGKLKRALKLSRSMPEESETEEVRHARDKMVLQRDHIKRDKKRRGNLD